MPVISALFELIIVRGLFSEDVKQADKPTKTASPPKPDLVDGSVKQESVSNLDVAHKIPGNGYTNLFLRFETQLEKKFENKKVKSATLYALLEKPTASNPNIADIEVHKHRFKAVNWGGFKKELNGCANQLNGIEGSSLKGIKSVWLLVLEPQSDADLTVLTSFANGEEASDFEEKHLTNLDLQVYLSEKLFDKVIITNDASDTI